MTTTVFVRVEGRRLRLVRTFRQSSRVRQRVFELPADPDRLRELALRLEQAAAQVERERAYRRPQAQPAPKPTRSRPATPGLCCSAGRMARSASLRGGTRLATPRRLPGCATTLATAATSTRPAGRDGDTRGFYGVGSRRLPNPPTPAKTRVSPPRTSSVSLTSGEHRFAEMGLDHRIRWDWCRRPHAGWENAVSKRNHLAHDMI